jgi:urease accessory protein
MGDFDVFGNVFVLTSPEQAEAIWARTPARYEESLATGLSRLPNNAGLAYKILAYETAPVAAAIREFWGSVRQTVRAAPVMEPFLWR